MKAYLDNGATTLIKPPSVSRAVKKAINELASPGRGGYRQAMKAAEKVYECRERAAVLFGVDRAENVIFTSSATHGLNIAIKSLVKPGDRVVVSGYEHNAVMRPLKALKAETIVAESRLFDRREAFEAFKAVLTPNTKAVICTHVSNVFGFELPVWEIGQLCRERDIPFIIDASQSAGSRQISLGDMKANFIAMPGHKGLYGPQGTGLLLCAARPSALMEGGTGSQSKSLDMPDFLPDMLEPGTHNVPGIAGLNEGLKYIEKQTVNSIWEHEKMLIDYTIDRLADNPTVEIYEKDGTTGTGVMSFNILGMDCEEAAERLGGRGIAVRAGLHCAPVAHKSAGTLQRGTIRASVSSFSSWRDCDRLADFVNSI